MASLAQVRKARQRLKLRKAGRKRKNQLSKRSTLSYTELFASCGEPGQPKS
jgi:hypothetical protein